VEWLAFDLHPEYPPEGIPRADLIAKYGPAMTDRMQAMFEASGLTYAPNPDVVPNSRLALELGEAARDARLHSKYHQRTMDAYWEEGRDISQPDELRSIASQVGLDRESVERALVDRAWSPVVDAATAAAHRAGINAVPAFVFDRRLLVLGAQPHEVLAAAVEEAAGLEPDEPEPQG
jgi:predicted DsbA family dithiol-disulfide isomerase